MFACFHGKYTDTFMQFLTVTASLYSIHHNVLGCHERQFCHHVFFDDFRIYNQTVYHVQAQIQDTVDRQKSFRNGKSLVCRIIQGSLKPLSRRCNCRIQCIYHHITGKRCDTLTSHRVTFVSHGGRSNLSLFKRFFYFF